MYALVNSSNYRFVIFACPNDANLPIFINKIVKDGPTATVWIHACERFYSDEPLKEAGVCVYDLSFPDGSTPSKSILDRWSKILKEHEGECIAIHCVAGLGRAPFLAAIAMIEDGKDCIETIKEIRASQPGALNLVQIRFLEGYKVRWSNRINKKGCLLL